MHGFMRSGRGNLLSLLSEKLNFITPESLSLSRPLPEGEGKTTAICGSYTVRYAHNTVKCGEYGHEKRTFLTTKRQMEQPQKQAIIRAALPPPLRRDHIRWLKKEESMATYSWSRRRNMDAAQFPQGSLAQSRPRRSYKASRQGQGDMVYAMKDELRPQGSGRSVGPPQVLLPLFPDPAALRNP